MSVEMNLLGLAFLVLFLSVRTNLNFAKIRKLSGTLENVVLAVKALERSVEDLRKQRDLESGRSSDVPPRPQTIAQAARSRKGRGK